MRTVTGRRPSSCRRQDCRTSGPIQFLYGRRLYRSCQRQPATPNPLTEKETASRTLSRPTEKIENREGGTGARTPSLGWSRSRGNDTFQGGTGKKNPNRIRVGILSIGGGGGNRTPVRKFSAVGTTCVAWLFGLTLCPPTGRLAQDDPLDFRARQHGDDGPYPMEMTLRVRVSANRGFRFGKGYEPGPSATQCSVQPVLSG